MLCFIIRTKFCSKVIYSTCYTDILPSLKTDNSNDTLQKENEDFKDYSSFMCISERIRHSNSFFLRSNSSSVISPLTNFVFSISIGLWVLLPF